MSATHPLLLELSRGACLLVATRRHLRRLRQDYDNFMLASGLTCWPTAQVLTVDSWLQALHQALLATGTCEERLLSEIESVALWEATAPDGLKLLPGSLHPAARNARQSWLALRSHLGSLAQVAGMELNADQRQFLEWAQRTEARLDALRLVDPGCLPLYLCERTHQLPPTGRLLLHRLSVLTPALTRLLGALAETGWHIEQTLASSTAVEPWLHRAPDRTAERSAWLDWARERLGRNPEARLAVITPELGECRAAIERDLLSMLQPELDEPGRTDQDRAFDLPGGESLARLAVTETMLDILRVSTTDSIDWPCLSRLLRSRYLNLEAEVQLKAFEAELRVRCAPTLGATWLLRECERMGLPMLAAAVAGGIRLLTGGRPGRTMDQWVEDFAACLELWGWPGTAVLGSDEFQAVEAVGVSLRRLAAAADVLGPLEPVSAATTVSQHLDVPFQPERGTPRLWLFDRYVDPGMDFDGLWVAGLTASRWPDSQPPNPLLPLALQRSLGLPGIDAGERVREARSLIECWGGSAPELIFSWPAVEDDASQSPSPLLQSGRAHVPTSNGPSRLIQLLGTGTLEPIPPSALMPLSGPIRGGSKLLEWQSACAFRACAQLRIAADRREDPTEGVDRALRGSILHDALRRFWIQTRSRQDLLDMTPASRLERAHSCVMAAIEERVGHRLGARARAIEATWQAAAMQQAIECDLQRRDFVVVDTEQKHTVELAGLRIGCTVDRIDEIEGQLLVIDYKTSKNLRTGSWFGQRPESPQLPLYAVAAVPDASAIAFFQVLSTTARLLGVGRELDKGISPPSGLDESHGEDPAALWGQQQREWTRQLSSLASDLAAGVAAVNPRAEDTCRNCHLQPACRVHWLPTDGDEAELDSES